MSTTTYYSFEYDNDNPVQGAPNYDANWVALDAALHTMILGEAGGEIGESGTGYDVKFWGDTADKYWLWDESADKMVLVGDSDQTGNAQLTGTLTVGVNDTGHDVTLYGATSGKNWLWDESADQMLVTGTSVLNGRVSLSSTLAGTNALILGAGKSGTNYALGSTAGNGLEFYLDATHTTGDMRGMYLRTYFSGTGGSGEAARIFATINNKTVASGGAVNGAHVSIGTVGASAAVSGQASALRATFGIAAASTTLGGTCTVLQLDSDLDTAVTVPTGMSFIRVTQLNTKKISNLFRLPNVAAETAGLFCAHTDQAMTHSIRIVSEAGTVYYLMATTTSTGRTES